MMTMNWETILTSAFMLSIGWGKIAGETRQMITRFLCPEDETGFGTLEVGKLKQSNS